MPRNDMTLNPDRPGARPDPVALLVELDTRLVDTLEGVDALRDRAEPGFRPVAEDFHALHTRQRAALGAMLQAEGHDPARDGSAFGVVHRATVALRDWVEGIDSGVMEPLVQAEKHVLQAYDAAIAAMPESDRRRVLESDRADLIATLDRHAGNGD